MGTNYYRIPKSSEVVTRYQQLIMDLGEMDLWSPSDAKNGFRTIRVTEYENMSPWQRFSGDLSVHLGKRSSGWKFCWNFNGNRFYSNKSELLKFIRSGRVVDEYGSEIAQEEFIQMALEWGQPDGAVLNEEYENQRREKNPDSFIWGPKYYDLEIDGLRVSRSTDFC